ncbi:hypothetical protein [Schleiferilactobacillus shenzhenensis]|uniref:Uncharacterized protein n=1 Tax=Schleiferilactobacillus shenzhenensis LY-73 TaxID=1231336 RepID=U4TQ17_9LACO|nr:hypothetical protein [Schleiferilactobacillus shenzhenensis]ERL63988.1 hypothetical protein L248_1731 [Schleiferilactobacillus shenzhenensis LY-73]
MTILYAVIVLALAVVVIIERRALRIKAQRRWWFTILLWVVAAAMLILPVWQKGGQQYLISGLFIAAVIVLLTLWRQGLTEFAVINGMLATRAFSGLTGYMLTETPDKPLAITFYGGSVRVTTLHLLASADEVRTFLKKHAPQIKPLREAPGER